MHKVLIPYFLALAVTPSTHSLEGTLLVCLVSNVYLYDCFSCMNILENRASFILDQVFLFIAIAKLKDPREVFNPLMVRLLLYGSHIICLLVQAGRDLKFFSLSMSGCFALCGLLVMVDSYFCTPQNSC